MLIFSGLLISTSAFAYTRYEQDGAGGYIITGDNGSYSRATEDGAGGYIVSGSNGYSHIISDGSGNYIEN